jgi:AcrR family transcriptional regulator
MPVSQLVRSTYHHGNLEDALIKSAIRLTRKNGPDHLSLREIAADVKVSPSAVYHYFPDKDALIRGIGEQLFSELAEMTKASLEKFPGNSARASRLRFREIGRAYLRWAVKEPNLFRLMFGGFCSVDGKKSHEEDMSFQILKKTLDDLVNTGAMPRKLRPYGEVMAWSSVHGAANLVVEGHLPEEAFEKLLDGLEIALGVK